LRFYGIGVKKSAGGGKKRKSLENLGMFPSPKKKTEKKSIRPKKRINVGVKKSVKG